MRYLFSLLSNLALSKKIGSRLFAYKKKKWKKIKPLYQTLGCTLRHIGRLH